VLALEELDPRHGPALGLFEKSEYPACRCGADENDLLVLLTDGLYEAAGADQQEFGRARLAAESGKRLTLPAPQLFAELLAVIQRFAGRELFEDDVCLVGVELAARGGR
jgi:serine phosphatase RsbU (regulator of sigma subunit)